jgi:hypothetical protein
MPAQPKENSPYKDRLAEEGFDRSDISDISDISAEDREPSGKAPERLNRDGSAPRKAAAAKIPAWEELLNESNDRVRYGAIQVKRLNISAIPTPSVLGQTLKDAVSTLKAAGLSITKIVQEYSHDVANGRVMVQLPSPGSGATRQMGVAVVVSKGPLPDADFDFAANLRPRAGSHKRSKDAWKSEV